MKFGCFRLWATGLSVAALGTFAGAASAATYGFDDIVAGGSSGTAEALQAISFEVIDNSDGTIDFKFTNASTPGTDDFFVDGLYWDFGSLSPVPLDNIAMNNDYDATTETGSMFSQGASPPVLPGGATISFTVDESADADPPAPKKGINRGEMFAVTFDLVGTYSYSDILGFLDDDELFVGVKVQGFDDGGSDAFVNNGCTDCGDDVNFDVPIPASLPLLAGGLGLAGFVLRRKQRKAA